MSKLFSYPRCYRLLLGVFPGVVFAQSETSLFEMSLEELTNVKVSIAARVDSPFVDTSAAVTVISHEYIQRSGATLLPELLRMVPGLHVGRADSNKWWVSIRGFGGRFNDKLQVMIDGRNIFTPLFSGTYWEHHMPPLKDIQRIEVIRGPGGASWGSNANNGVINIITKHSEQTQGTHVSALAGDNEVKRHGLLRHGFSTETLSGRVYAQKNEHGGGELTNISKTVDLGLQPGDDGNDEWDHDLLGFRLDTKLGSQTLMVAAEEFDADYDQTRLTGMALNIPRQDTIESKGQFLIGKWSMPVGDRQVLSVNGSVESTERNDASLEEKRNSHNVLIQHQLDSNNHQIVTGYSYTRSADETQQVSTVVFVPADKTLDYHGLFIQDSYAFNSDNTIITAGIRYDKNEYTQWEYQPTLRLLHKLDQENRVWAALSKSMVSPGRVDVEFGQQFGPTFVLFGNPNQQPETVEALEGGYRHTADNILFEATAFFNQYAHLHQDIYSTGQRADLFGIEFNLTKRWMPGLSTSMQYAFHDNDDKNGQPNILGESGIDNIKQLSGVQLNWDLNERLQFNFSAFYNTDILPERDDDAYSSNMKVDANVQYRFNKHVNIIFAGQNLLDAADTQVDDGTRLNTGVTRAYYVKAELDF